MSTISLGRAEGVRQWFPEGNRRFGGRDARRSIIEDTRRLIGAHVCTLIAIFGALAFLGFVTGRPAAGSIAAAILFILGELPLKKETRAEDGKNRNL